MYLKTSQQLMKMIQQGCKLLGKHKKRAAAVLFVILEAISFVLDLVGKSKWNFLVAAFLLAAIAFAITIYTNCIIERSRSQLQAHHHRNDQSKQLRVVVEIVFSAVQLFVTSIHLILVNLDIKNNYNASVSPLVFAIIVLVFIFKKDDDEEVILTLNEEVTNISLNDINHVPSITLSEDFLEEIVDENSYLMSSLVSKSSNFAPRNVEVHMFTTGVYKTIDLATLNSYEDLYRKVEELFNIEGQLFGFRSQKQLVYVGDDDFVLILGDDPWNEFCKVVKKIFIYIRKLREDPRTHIKDFFTVCAIILNGGVSDGEIRLRLFPFSLKEKAKEWLYSLPSGSITTWVDLVAKFLSKKFPTQRTDKIQKEIIGVQQLDNESLHEYWERFPRLLNSCLHHGIEEWLLMKSFYEGLLDSERIMVDATSGGGLMNKNAMEQERCLRLFTITFNNSTTEELLQIKSVHMRTTWSHAKPSHFRSGKELGEDVKEEVEVNNEAKEEKETPQPRSKNSPRS
ncbi:hypothetical protein Q3G72_001682 [Acer saccharum]|nr:hypothetical protein Q3G72_001682 [Acer saccharum]